MSSAYCRFAPGDPTHGVYHDTEYGFPTEDESVLFERLMLEINQAGLSWATILRKRAAFRAAYADFTVDRVAAFGAAEIERLLADPGIIRNRLKIEAATEDARRIQALRQSHVRRPPGSPTATSSTDVHRHRTARRRRGAGRHPAPPREPCRTGCRNISTAAPSCPSFFFAIRA